ncbi:unnamed protein product [Peniophora sp. CBMAI 1063]|nr:unnamed protein product [Peniophora sp. CBMAI 1063]
MAGRLSRRTSDGFRHFRQWVGRFFGRLAIWKYGRLTFHRLWTLLFRCLPFKSKPPIPAPDPPPSQVRLHALIIGIDDYKSDRVLNLHGAVSDADAVNEYLRKDLQVPATQIVNLRDKAAARDVILRELQALGTREDIRKGDQILIYYAGYGATADTPDGWATKGDKLSTIVPYDGLAESDDARRIYPIPHQTIEAVLRNLARQIGNGNDITVIFDCCYSGSVTTPHDPSRLVRGLDLTKEDTIPADLDQSIWRGILEADAPVPSLSCVLLAACREGGIAQEIGSRGQFTQALLEALRSVSRRKVSYLELLQRVPNIPGQNPICEGHCLDRSFFNTLALDKERTLHPMLSKDDAIVIDAGFLQGVSPDAEFKIYAHERPALGDEPSAIMIPKSVHASSTDLKYSPSSLVQTLDFSGQLSYYAEQTSLGKVAGLRLHLPSDSEGRNTILEALTKVSQPRTSGPAVLSVDDAAQADLSLLVSANEVQYIIYEPTIKACGLSELRQSSKADTTKPIYTVLRAAAHFFRFMRHSPTENRLRDTVHVEVYALEVDEEGELGPDLRRPWITSGGNINEAGFVDVVADDDTPYGIKVRNDSDTPLHIWAFYFDCSGLAISEYYRPPAIGQGAEPSLPAHGVLTIGYGAGGGLPYTFFLREGQELDLGFIKLFISAEPIDFSSIEQRSPFKDPVARGKKKRSAEFDAGWDTITIAVVQRKP